MPGLKARMKTTCLLMKVKAGEGELSVKKLPAVEKGQPQKELDHQVWACLTVFYDIFNTSIAICSSYWYCKEVQQ